MPVTAEIIVSAAVEGPTDEAVIRRLLKLVGAAPGSMYGKCGKDHLCRRIQGYNNAARIAPWFVLVDLNSDVTCAPPLRESWLPEVSRYMCFRIAIREVESWLLADCDRISSFLSVSPARIPRDPESVTDPKMTMLDLARHSKRRAVREDMVPRQDSGRSGYRNFRCTSRLFRLVYAPASEIYGGYSQACRLRKGS